MTFADINEDNISSVLRSKDSKSTQHSVTRSIKLFKDYLLQKDESVDFETFSKEKLYANCFKQQLHSKFYFHLKWERQDITKFMTEPTSTSYYTLKKWLFNFFHIKSKIWKSNCFSGFDLLLNIHCYQISTVFTFCFYIIYLDVYYMYYDKTFYNHKQIAKTPKKSHK